MKGTYLATTLIVTMAVTVGCRTSSKEKSEDEQPAHENSPTQVHRIDFKPPNHPAAPVGTVQFNDQGTLDKLQFVIRLRPNSSGACRDHFPAQTPVGSVRCLSSQEQKTVVAAHTKQLCEKDSSKTLAPTEAFEFKNCQKAQVNGLSLDQGTKLEILQL